MLPAHDGGLNRRIRLSKKELHAESWLGSGQTIAVSAKRGRPYYLLALIIGIGASSGIIVGSIAPWLKVFVISANGLDIDGWGIVTLALGLASAVALVSQWNSLKTTSEIWSAVPLACSVFVAGVTCLALAVINIIRFTSISDRVLGGNFDVQVGWGLWLVAISSAVLSSAMAMAAFLDQAGIERMEPSPPTWTAAWVWAAVFGSAVIVLCAITYVWARQITGYDDSLWLRLFEQYLARNGTI
jgi:hypothetical protein